MNINEFNRAQYPCQFSKNNVAGAITFITLAIIIFMSVFLVDASNTIDKQQQEIHNIRMAYRVELFKVKHLEEQSNELNEIITRYEQERMLVVDVSAYTNRVRETDNTPNITATQDKVVAGYTVAVSHDLKYLLGHRVYIYGLGVFVAQDLMDDRWTDKVDIYYDKSMLKEALDFGLKKNRSLVVLNKVINYEKGNIK